MGTYCIAPTIRPCLIVGLFHQGLRVLGLLSGNIQSRDYCPLYPIHFVFLTWDRVWDKLSPCLFGFMPRLIKP